MNSIFGLDAKIFHQMRMSSIQLSGFDHDPLPDHGSGSPWLWAEGDSSRSEICGTSVTSLQSRSFVQEAVIWRYLCSPRFVEEEEESQHIPSPRHYPHIIMLPCVFLCVCFSYGRKERPVREAT